VSSGRCRDAYGEPARAPPGPASSAAAVAHTLSAAPDTIARVSSHTNAEEARARFAALAAEPEHAIDLGLGALLIAAEERPGQVDVEAGLARLDALARDAAPSVALAPDARGQVLALTRHLFEVEGFEGDRERYDDPRNSHLDQVLDRRRGLPITLAVVLVEVARRLDVPLVGVAFPAHFLVRHRELDLVLDPFDGGRELGPDDCQAILARLAAPVTFDRGLLTPARPRDVLARMLRNLKASHLRRGQLETALRSVERILLLRPDDLDETRDRGLLRALLRRWGPAQDDLARYIAARPHAPDGGEVRARLASVRQALWQLN